MRSTATSSNLPPPPSTSPRLANPLSAYGMLTHPQHHHSFQSASPSLTTMNSIANRGLEHAIQTRSVDARQLEPRCLYAVLTSRNALGAWNWSFFIPNDDSRAQGQLIGSDGVLFHAVMDSAGTWTFEHQRHYNAMSCQLTVAIVKLASLAFLGPSSQVVEELLPIFRMVPMPTQISNQDPAEFSSRTWFLEGIGTLNDCGILTCDDVWLLEREIRRCAFLAMDNFLDINNRRIQSHDSRGTWNPDTFILCDTTVIDLNTLPNKGWTLYIAQNCF